MRALMNSILEFPPGLWVLAVLAAGFTVFYSLTWWRRRTPRTSGELVADDVCWFHYNRFRPGDRCRRCGLNGGYTGVRQVIAVLDNSRVPGEWKVQDVPSADSGVEATYESHGAPPAWEDDGVLRVDWLHYGKALHFDEVEIVRATDPELERFVQHARFESDPVVRESLRRMTCVITSDPTFSENMARVLKGTFCRVVSRIEPSTLTHRRPRTSRQFPICPETPLDSMVWIDPGTFLMGSPDDERDRGPDEGPQTNVTFTRGYWLGSRAVTQREWGAVMGFNPSHFKGHLDRPVESVTWIEAMEYCARLTERQRMAGRLPGGRVFRLPTEAQWEYACRAGTTTPTAFGEQLDATNANFDARSLADEIDQGEFIGETTIAGRYPANAWGFHDMHGNVWEWCLDWYQNRLPGGSVTDPSGPATGSSRVFRGGSWDRNAASCRSALRYCRYPEFRSYSLGFRLALVAGQ